METVALFFDYLVIGGAILGSFFAIIAYNLYFPSIMEGSESNPYDARLKRLDQATDEAVV